MISPLFTSLERLRAGASQSVTTHDNDLLSCGVAASAMMQGYMSRGIRIESRAETYRAPPSGIIFLRYSPVVSVASVTARNSDGSSRALPFWNCDTNELHVTTAVDRLTAIDITYTGGMGAGKARYSVTTNAPSGTPAIGAVTGTGGIVGNLVSWSSSLVAIIETTAGSIDTGAVISGSGFSFTVVDSAQEVDLSGYRDLQKACEQQAVYMFQRRTSLGRTASTMGGTTTFEKDYDLLPGVERILDIYSPPIAF